MKDAASWVTALGTLLLAAVAVFQDKIRGCLTRPKLELEVRAAPPDCHLTTWRMEEVVRDSNTGQQFVRHAEIPCYYFRMRITNNGNSEAREVEVFAKSLKRHHEVRGEFEEIQRFTPMNLLWSNIRQPFLSVLSPQIPKMCDLAHLVPPKQRQRLGHELPDVPPEATILALDLQVQPNSGGHLLGSGHYRLSLVLAAANASPREYTLDIRVTGDWYNEEGRMLTDGVRLRLQ